MKDKNKGKRECFEEVIYYKYADDELEPQPRQKVVIYAKVVNKGGSWGSSRIDLTINGQYEQSIPDVGVAPGTVKPINFTVYKERAGENQVVMGDAMATFYVVEEEVPERPSAPGLLPAGVSGELHTTGLISVLLIGIIVIALVVLAILFSLRR